MNRDKGLEWAKARAKLEANAERLWSLNEMERTGGEPDVVGQDKKSGEYVFFDCSEQTPVGRTSLCYDREALESRKEHKPESSAIDMAAAMGIELEREQHGREKHNLTIVFRIISCSLLPLTCHSQFFKFLTPASPPPARR